MNELIRLKGSDKVYYLKATKHWVKDVDTLTSMGFKLGDEVYVDATEFAKYEEGEPIEIEKDEAVVVSDKGVFGLAGSEEASEAQKNLDDIRHDVEIVSDTKEIWQ